MVRHHSIPKHQLKLPVGSEWTLGPEVVLAHVPAAWHDKCLNRDVIASTIQIHTLVRRTGPSISTNLPALPNGIVQASGARLIVRAYADVGGFEAVVGVAEAEAGFLRQDQRLPPIIITDSLASSIRVTAQLWMQQNTQINAEVQGAIALGDAR